MIRNIARQGAGLTSNAFLVDGDRTVLVDAGSGFDAVEAIRSATGGVDAIVLTHTHSDHIGNVADVVEAFGVDVWGFDPGADSVTHGIDDGETVQLGDHEYLAIHTPGHKDDHLCFYAEAPGILFAGDLVFANGGFGRTDLAGGDRGTLIRSIETVLEATEPGLAEIHTGHGPSVTENPRNTIELALRAARMGG
ncbi:MAG: MBL fold metallo-hydrolase [Salinirussus sp.]